ncbi:MAG: 4-alpha-glucanotransferase, partial [Epulopiscium sp. Nuni2H_MBin003]
MIRSSGIIMHISSLDEKYGIGTFGSAAYKFADFLNRAGQKYWQVLPLGHTGYGDSPYQSFSAFAGNPYFIDLDILEEEGLLKKDDYVNIDFGTDPEYIDFGKLFKQRIAVLEIAYENSKGKLDKQLDKFKEKENLWLEDYALFMAIKEHTGNIAYVDWEDDIKLRKPEAIIKYKTELKDRIEFWNFIQYEFFRQWMSLKAYTNSLGIEIIGDIPIYVSADSADAWANPKMFKLDKDRNPTVVAGCPPDAFSKTGQLWGNPIYDWEYLKDTEYRWWIDRLRESLKLFDIVRIDHFRGFESYWEVPFGENTAINGEWVKGPKLRLFKAIEKELGDIKIIAEDLGYLTPETVEFLQDTGYPGMKVLQFAFDSREESDYIPHIYDKNCIVYTGTHDNDTIMGWMEETGNKDDINHAKEYLHLTKEEGLNWGFIRGAWASNGNVALTQLQDLLGLGNEARMNYPSTLGENWIWRVKPGVITNKLADKLYKMTKLYGRCKEGAVITKRNLNKEDILKSMATYAKVNYGRNINTATDKELLNCLGLALREQMVDDIEATENLYNTVRKAYYFSAEYLMGRALGNNLISLGLYDEIKELLEELGIDIN